MEKCTRIGCGASFDPADNSAADCHFHPGAPLFHEGSKSYSCCKDTNKPVLTFDEFLKIPGCTTGSHSSEKSEVKAPVVTAPSAQQQKTDAPKSDAKPSAATEAVVASTANLTISGPPTFKSRPSAPSTATNDVAATGADAAQEQDPPNAAIPANTRCKRTGCTCTYSEEAPRSDEECLFHPLPAIFHEGSKGYACCKRRVLEFDEFLKIEGCKRGKHLFVGRPKKDGEEEYVQCRSDMYQTPTQVICSVFGKGADKERSKITFEEWELHVDLFLPSSKRFTKTYSLYGPIDGAASSYKVMGTKVELTLVKGDGRSWPSLEAPKQPGKNVSQVTFGVTGRTGSVGAKDMVYRGDVVHV